MDDLNVILPELKKALQEHYGDRLVKLILYGSHARGDATEDSDIDVMVVLRGLEHAEASKELDATIDIVCDINLKHDTLLTLLPIGEGRFTEYYSPLLLNVRKEGVTI